jgi:cell division protein FtsB
VKVDLGIWSKLTQAVVALVAIALILLTAMWYLPEIQQNERMRADIYRLNEKITQQEAVAKELQTEIDALRNDPKTVERLAREKLGYAKADETVIRFETNSP